MNHDDKRMRAQNAAAVVGVDAGKYKHALAVRPRVGHECEPFLVDTTRAGYDRAVRGIFQHVPEARPEDVLVGVEFAGNYGFTLAHFLREVGFQVVSVLPKHTKQWKEVRHNQLLKTDPKDAMTIVDLAAQGHFVAFPFLEQCYADLRYLVSNRERLSKLRTATIGRLRDVLQVVWPEFESRFGDFSKRTPLALLREYPGPKAFLAAPKRRVIQLIEKASRGHLGEGVYAELFNAARQTVALPGAQGVLGEEIGLQLDLLSTYDGQIDAIEELMVRTLERTSEADALLSIPKLGPVTAAVFLGSLGDPQAYESSRQALRIAGLTLVVSESGIRHGRPRISKRGRPEFRRHMYLFAVRSVSAGGIFHDDYRQALRRNGGRKIAALTAIARKATCLMFSIARDRRCYTPERP